MGVFYPRLFFEELKFVEKNFVIEQDYITLGQFLKGAALISSGGMAKPYLETTSILLNGEKENRRGKKLYPNDKIEVQDEGTFRIRASEGGTEGANS